MRRYWNACAFKHPRRWTCMEKGEWVGLDWYYDEWMNTVRELDYGIAAVMGREGATRIILRREGDADAGGPGGGAEFREVRLWHASFPSPWVPRPPFRGVRSRCCLPGSGPIRSTPFNCPLHWATSSGGGGPGRTDWPTLDRSNIRWALGGASGFARP